MPETTRIDDPVQARETLADRTKDVRFAMLTTIGATGAAHCRPMATHEAEDDGTLWFFTYGDDQKARDVEGNPQVCLGYADPGKNLWISVTGTATVVRDRAKVEELWSAPLKAFFPDGPQDPNVVLLRVTPVEGEVWDGPSSTVGKAVAFARTLGSDKNQLGDDVKLSL